MSDICFSYGPSDLSLMPPRKAESNKGSYGRVLCVCGSVGMAGAAYLCASAALRTGAGLVEVLTPEENRVIIQTLLPEAIVSVYDKDSPSIEQIDACLTRANAVVCGCGLGVGSASRALLGRVLRKVQVPTVLDADALNIISKSPTLLKYAANKIITPHPMEMSRLCAQDVSDINADRESVCSDFAESHSLICVLKGHRTVVSDGKSVFINTSGNSGMATAGSGDVLAGIIGGILAQNTEGKLDMLQAASLGVYVHGLCGDAAAQKLGEYSVIASDIVANLPDVLKEIPR